MSRREIRETPRNDRLPDQLAKGEDEQRLGRSQEKCGEHIAGPMRAEIDARPPHCDGDEPVQFPPAPVKKRAADGDDSVVVRVPGWKRCAGTRSFVLVGNANERFPKYRQQHWSRLFQLDHPHGFELLWAGTTDDAFERIDDAVGQPKDKGCANDKCATAKTAEDEERDGNGNEERDPDIRTTDHGHEQVECSPRPSLVDRMKNRFVHFVSRQRENRSARRVKQAALLFALVLSPALARAQNFPDAQEVLSGVRLRQAQQQIDLRGQLRQEATIVPFHLVQEGPMVRYIFSNPDETLQLRLGQSDSRLDEISRNGITKISGARLDDPIRGTAVTYEDLALKFLYWPNARVIGADFIRTRNCWRMQLEAPANDSQYGRVVLWVDKDNGALMRMEASDRAGKISKRFEVVSAQKIEGRWYLKQMRVEAIDPQSNRVTARTYLEIKAEPARSPSS